MFNKFCCLLSAKNSFIFSNFYFERIDFNKRTIQFIKYLSYIILHLVTVFITNYDSFLDERLTNSRIKKFHGFFKSVTKFIYKKLVDKIPKITRWLIISLKPLKQASTTHNFKIFILMQFYVLSIFVFSTLFVPTEILCWIIFLGSPWNAKLRLKLLYFSFLN